MENIGFEVKLFGEKLVKNRGYREILKVIIIQNLEEDNTKKELIEK